MFFHGVPEGLPDPIFGLNEAFRADPRTSKIDLVIGIYKDEALRTHLMSSVKKAKEQILTEDLAADYLPIDGLRSFCDEMGALAFGDDLWKAHQGRIYSAQMLGGTGALQIGAAFLAQEISKEAVLSTPTWPNHRAIFERAGCKVGFYPYYSRSLHGVDQEALFSFLKTLPEKTIVLLHQVCHNPTGCDFSQEQWRALSQLMRKQKLIPFFDCAYHGFGDGIEQDRIGLETFLHDGHEMLIAYSCSKNFSLYCQRVGALFIVGNDLSVKARVGSQVKRIIRSLYSNPPAHGARIALHILQNNALKREWQQELAAMRHRLAASRQLLIRCLSQEAPERDFHFLQRQKGMFSLLDLDPAETQALIRQFGIYLPENGRISLTGLSPHNTAAVAQGVATVTRGG